MGFDRSVYFVYPKDVIPSLERQVMALREFGLSFELSGYAFVIEDGEVRDSDFADVILDEEALIKGGLASLPVIQNWQTLNDVWFKLGTVSIDGHYVTTMRMTDRALHRMRNHFQLAPITLPVMLMLFSQRIGADFTVGSSEFGPGPLHIVASYASAGRLKNLAVSEVGLVYDANLQEKNLEKMPNFEWQESPMGALLVAWPFVLHPQADSRAFNPPSEH